MAEQITNDNARMLRELWFSYLDTVKPVRPKLHAYCLKLTGSVFDAEDLVHDALLKGFAAIGRGDFPSERILDLRAYFCRIATNSWIDRRRRESRETADQEPDNAATREPNVLTRSAAASLFDRASPQERAAIVLKDAFDFSLEDIADILATSVGAVKSALHKGREKLAESRQRLRPSFTPASTTLLDRFIEAFRVRDIEAVTSLLLESTTYEVLGVGFERGRKGQWINIALGNAAIEGVRSERHFLESEWVHVAVHESSRGKLLLGVLRLAEADGKIARLINYFYCPDTLAHVAGALNMRPPERDYHQDPETLARMIAAARIPWAN